MMNTNQDGTVKVNLINCISKEPDDIGVAYWFCNTSRPEELEVLLEFESSGTNSNEQSGNKSVEILEEGTPQKAELIIK